jgi:hypothetical protein
MTSFPTSWIVIDDVVSLLISGHEIIDVLYIYSYTSTSIWLIEEVDMVYSDFSPRINIHK